MSISVTEATLALREDLDIPTTRNAAGLVQLPTILATHVTCRARRIGTLRLVNICRVQCIGLLDYLHIVIPACWQSKGFSTLTLSPTSLLLTTYFFLYFLYTQALRFED